jgi:hypothetical protein
LLVNFKPAALESLLEVELVLVLVVVVVVVVATLHVLAAVVKSLIKQHMLFE